jgi:hypothetical protein
VSSVATIILYGVECAGSTPTTLRLKWSEKEGYKVGMFLAEICSLVLPECNFPLID